VAILRSSPRSAVEVVVPSATGFNSVTGAIYALSVRRCAQGLPEMRVMARGAHIVIAG